MERTKVIRSLRIAWSVWWGILGVLLVVLWVRSYWFSDVLTRVYLPRVAWRSDEYNCKVSADGGGIHVAYLPSWSRNAEASWTWNSHRFRPTSPIRRTSWWFRYIDY